jgi:3',5'-cyclic-AMP phosphodiesterase
MIARRMADSRPFIIAHLSDLHCGSPYFVANLLERAILEINEIEPDVVVCSGDLTTFGYKQEYAQARSYLDRLDCPDVITIPGNHDSRNVGYVHFEEMIGPRSTVLQKQGITFVAVDSSEPDLDHGVVGRSRYAWIEEQFQPPAEFRVFVLHHHLLPPQARSLRLEAGGPVRRQRRHRLVDARARAHQALLQRGRDRCRHGRHLPALPVPWP